MEDRNQIKPAHRLEKRGNEHKAEFCIVRRWITKPDEGDFQRVFNYGSHGLPRIFQRRNDLTEARKGSEGAKVHGSLAFPALRCIGLK